jgi:hypothetical protein
MKDIKDMTLTELADLNPFYLSEKDWRNTQSRLRELHELTRWIPVGERMPTEEEHGNEVFRVWVLGGETDACFVSGKIMVWVDSPFEADYEEYDPKRYKTAFTHWQRITPPEGL